MYSVQNKFYICIEIPQMHLDLNFLLKSFKGIEWPLYKISFNLKLFVGSYNKICMK